MANSDVLRSRFASTDLAKRGRVRECLKCDDVGDKKEMSDHVLRVHMEEDEVPFRVRPARSGLPGGHRGRNTCAGCIPTRTRRSEEKRRTGRTG